MVSAQAVVNQISDNWPGIVYILLMLGFSVCFLRERREESRLHLQMSERLLQVISGRLDRLEQLVKQSPAQSVAEEHFDRRADQVGRRVSPSSPSALL